MKTFKFYFDFLSPFSYLAFQKLKKKELNFTLHPVTLGSLLNHWEIKGPGEITPKREFLLKQCYRMAALEGITFTTPKTHPFNPLYALRMSLKTASGDDQCKVIDAFWQAAWQKGKDLGDPDECLRVLNDVGLDAQKIYDLSFTKESRAEFKANISEAISYGAFGVPSFVVGDELFWGQDSLKYLELYLKGEDPLDRDIFQQAIDHTPRAAAQKIN